jgi:hypothetical protein
MKRYFAYGSNLDVAAMATRCPGARLVGPAALQGWSFGLDASGYATIVPASVERGAGAKVFGLLWTIKAADERALDGYESVATGLYRKEFLPVRHMSGGASLPALVYVANGPLGVRPRQPYLDEVIAAARAQGLPADYIATLARLAKC